MGFFAIRMNNLFKIKLWMNSHIHSARVNEWRMNMNIFNYYSWIIIFFNYYQKDCFYCHIMHLVFNYNWPTNKKMRYHYSFIDKTGKIVLIVGFFKKIGLTVSFFFKFDYSWIFMTIRHSLSFFLAPPSVFFEIFLEIGLNSNFFFKKSAIIHE